MNETPTKSPQPTSDPAQTTAPTKELELTKELEPASATTKADVVREVAPTTKTAPVASEPEASEPAAPEAPEPAPTYEFSEVVIDIRRVVKVTKGGRNFRFAAVVVIGDHHGLVGLGTARAREVPNAIKKAIANAKKNILRVVTVNHTIPYEVIGRHGAARVLLMPAQPGHGITAGGAVRSIMELSGLKNIRTKKIGAGNPINILRATINGLQQLASIQTTVDCRVNSLAQARQAKSSETKGTA